jgi:GNAT superfamily N-acetyltransferase
MNIRIAVTDAELSACYPVMLELRPHLERDAFVPRIRMQEQTGYRLAFVEDQEGVTAVAGFRLGENLAWGRHLYVDDLVARSAYRSRGYGAGLLAWLKDYAVREGCVQLHLDSGVQRKDAHRFYEREGMTITSYHFATLMVR